MKKNKIFLLYITFLTSAFVFSAFPQKNRMNIADFEKRKMEFIKKEAEISDTEAAQFFPIFNELAKKKFDLHKGHRDQIQEMKEQGIELSSEEYKKLFENDIEVKLKEAELDKKYSEKLEKVLTPEKLYKAQQAERKFMQQELKKYREK